MKNIRDILDLKHKKSLRLGSTTAERQYGRNVQRVLCIFGVVPLQVSGGNTK